MFTNMVKYTSIFLNDLMLLSKTSIYCISIHILHFIIAFVSENMQLIPYIFAIYFSKFNSILYYFKV